MDSNSGAGTAAHPDGKRILYWLGVFAFFAGACTSSSTPVADTLPGEPSTTTVPTSTTTSIPVTTTAVPAGTDYAWQAGDCFDFGRVRSIESLPYAPYGDDGLIGCGQPHTHEVFVVDRTPEGPEAEYPGPELLARVQQTCMVEFVDYIGLYPSDSTLDLIYYLPDADEWAAGERYMACVVYGADSGGVARQSAGSVAGAGDEYAWLPGAGDCYREDFDTIRLGERVDCGDTHSLEIIGIFEHPAEPGEPFPAIEPFAEFIRQSCDDARSRSIPDEGRDAISVGWLPFSEAEWLAGYRRVVCIAFVTSGFGQLLEVRGPLSGDWEVVGVFGDPGTFTA